MTAVAIFALRDCVHVVTDSTCYVDGNVNAFRSKCNPIATWPGAITGGGSSLNTILFRIGLEQQFSSWDEMISGAEAFLPEMVRRYELSASTVFLAGISATRGPEVYGFDNDGPLPDYISKAEKDASPYTREPYKLVKLPRSCVMPVPPLEVVIAANWEGLDDDADTDLVIWSARKYLLMQRSMEHPEGFGGIGGWFELTTVSAAGVIQRVIERFPDDKTGAPLRCEPIDWTRWHADNPKPGTSRILCRSGLSQKARSLHLV